MLMNAYAYAYEDERSENKYLLYVTIKSSSLSWTSPGGWIKRIRCELITFAESTATE